MGELYGMIFNIQKFSINDGAGIRTVVFFKGCPLRCGWCSNPESQSLDVETMLDERQDKAHAMKTVGERRTVDEIMRVVMQDKPFYEESGGGVTLSGGEAMMQPEFAIALLKALKEKGIHTAIETTGFASPAVFNRIIEHLDLLLFDIKHWDETQHKKATRVSNIPILKNMKHAIEIGKEVLPRLPVIPNYNDSIADAHGFVRRLNEVGARRVQLLPFHQFGENKYHMLGRQYDYADIKSLHPEDLTDFQRIFVNSGIDAFF